MATEAQLSFPTSVFKYKNEIYITDYGNDRIRKILENGIIITIAASGECGFNGDNQLASAAQLKQPYCLSVHNDEVYFSDMGNHRIRKILSNGTIQTIAGNGIGGFNGDHILATESLVNSSNSIFVSHVEHVYFTEYGNQRVRMIDSQNGTISTVAGTGIVGYSGDDLFDFTRYFHIGPQKQIKPFSKRKDGPFVPFYHDMAIKWITYQQVMMKIMNMFHRFFHKSFGFNNLKYATYVRWNYATTNKTCLWQDNLLRGEPKSYHTSHGVQVLWKL